MKVKETFLRAAFSSATLIHKQKIARHTFHLTIKLSNPMANYTPGQHLRIVVGSNNLLAPNDFIRTYSVWNYNAEKLEVDIAICTFSNGQGSKWVTNVEVGEKVYFSGPKGKFVFNDSVDNYLLIGDISSLSPLYEIVRQVQSGKKYTGFIVADDMSDFYNDINSSISFNVIVKKDDMINQIKSLLHERKLELDNTIVYIAGEANFCKILNSYFRHEQNMSTKKLYVKPFWHPGKKGLE